MNKEKMNKENLRWWTLGSLGPFTPETWAEYENYLKSEQHQVDLQKWAKASAEYEWAKASAEYAKAKADQSQGIIAKFIKRLRRKK